MGKKGDPVDGVLLLDKPAGMSSNWALQLSRRLLNARKAGHTGTLDPMATGLLPLAFGNATKFSADLLAADKTYLAEIAFGAATDTMDSSGEVTETGRAGVSRGELEAVLPEFTGKISQVPPMYSAVKHGGRNLYELARRGVEVDRRARTVTVFSLGLKEFSGSRAVVEAAVSKGTYIRVLADDIGRRLGTFAHLTALRRIRVGSISIDDAVPFAEVDDKSKTVEERRGLLKGADFLLSTLPEVCLDDAGARRLRQGQRLAAGSPVRGEARAYGPGRQLLGVVEVDARGTIHPLRLIRYEEDASVPREA